MRSKPMMCSLLALGLALPLLVAASAGAAARMKSEVKCQPTEEAMAYLCTIKLSDRKTGAPIEGAKFMMHPSMPTMPMAHRMKPVEGMPGAEAGVYHGMFHFGMAGEWAIDLRVAAPARDQMRHTIMVGKPGEGMAHGEKGMQKMPMKDHKPQ